MAVSWPYRGRIEAIPNVLFIEKMAVSWPLGKAVSWPYRGRIEAVSRPYRGRNVAVYRPYLMYPFARNI